MAKDAKGLARETIWERIPAPVYSTLSGLLFCASFVGVFELFFAFICFIPLLWLIAKRDLPLRQTALHSFWTGFSAFGLACYWAPEAMALYSASNLWLGALAWFCVAFLQALPIAFFGGLTQKLTRAGVPLAISATAVLVAVEALWPRPFAHTLGASAHGQLQLSQLAAFGGPTLITAAIIFFSASLAVLKKRWVAGSASALLICLVFGHFYAGHVEGLMKAAPQKKIGLVQEALAALEKHTAPREEVRRHLKSSRMLAGADLVIWPETTVAYRLDQSIEDLSPGVFEGEPGMPILLGGYQRRRVGGAELISNSAFLVDAQGKKLGVYDKKYLFPLTEKVPFSESINDLSPASLALPKLAAGTGDGILEIADMKIGAMICYEDMYSELVRDLVDGGANLLVSLSNDAWFGETVGPSQHLALSKLRAIEVQRSFVRATNTGISVIIAPNGRELARAPMNQRATLMESVPLMEGTTVYAMSGDWPGWLGLFFCSFILICPYIRKGRLFGKND